MLVKSIIVTVLHDTRVGVGEIVLVLITGAGHWRLRWFSPRPTPLAFGFRFPFPDFGFIGSLFGFIAFLGTRLQDGFGLRQIFQTKLSPRNFIFNDQAAW